MQVPETDSVVVGPNGVGRVWDPNEEGDEDDEEEKLIARKTMIARSMGAVELDEAVEQRWKDWGQVVGEELGETRALLRLGSMGGWEQVEDESAEAGGAGGGSTAVVEDKESKEVDSAPAATAQEGQEENQDFENTIHDWIADYRKDSSQDMKMQIRMYALQVDIHQRSKAARLILKDILHKEETMLNIETQTGKEGKLVVFGVKVVLGWKCMYSHRCSVLFVHCSLFFVLCICASSVKQTIVALLRSWQYVLKSFVQDYSHAGYACLAAIEDYVCETMSDNVIQAFPFVVMAL